MQKIISMRLCMLQRVDAVVRPNIAHVLNSLSMAHILNCHLYQFRPIIVILLHMKTFFYYSMYNSTIKFSLLKFVLIKPYFNNVIDIMKRQQYFYVVKRTSEFRYVPVSALHKACVTVEGFDPNMVKSRILLMPCSSLSEYN